MICDRIENAQMYYCLGERFEKALAFLQQTDLSGYGPGVYDIRGREIFLKIQSYATDRPENCKIEVHERYADVQLILEGQEEMGYIHRSRTAPSVPYDGETDMALVTCDEMGRILQRPGCFVIAFPQDAHQSCRVLGQSCRVKKALVKVLL